MKTKKVKGLPDVVKKYLKTCEMRNGKPVVDGNGIAGVLKKHGVKFIKAN